MPDEDDVDDINSAIVTSATSGIRSAVVDGNSVVAQSVEEQIAAANHIANQNAASRGHFGLRFTTLVPPGCG